MTTGRTICALALLMGSAASAAAQDAARPALPPLLPEAREIELARSAGLPAWTGEATVYTLRRGGFQVARQGSNGFTCMVQRERPDTLEPICYDPEGKETILPRALRETQLREQGKSEADIAADSKERFRTGEYRAPRRTGIAYMLSKENRVFNGEKTIWFPPHLMFYALRQERRYWRRAAIHAAVAPGVVRERPARVYHRGCAGEHAAAAGRLAAPALRPASQGR